VAARPVDHESRGPSDTMTASGIVSGIELTKIAGDCTGGWVAI
jgi:hypothetical protein